MYANVRCELMHQMENDLSKMQKRKIDSCTGGRTSQNPFLKEGRKRNERKRTEIITFCRNDRRADAG